MKIVSLDNISQENYKTPKNNLMHLYSVGQKIEHICNSKNLLGLSAAQFGLPWNFFVYWDNYPNNKKSFSYLVDCEYHGIGNKFPSIESCASLDSQRFKLERYGSIIVKGQQLIIKDDDLLLVKLENKFEGVLAVVIQHEVDHSFGRDKMIDKIGTRMHIS